MLLWKLRVLVAAQFPNKAAYYRKYDMVLTLSRWVVIVPRHEEAQSF